MSKSFDFKMHTIEGTFFTYYVSSSPDTSNISNYKDLLLKNEVTNVIRLCNPLYDASELNPITVHEMCIDDGEIPLDDMVDQWITLLKKWKSEGKSNIALHCTAGLGRAPMMVCISMIKIEKYSCLNAIDLLRENIKGCINRKQLNYLTNLKHKQNCTIM